MIAITSSNDDDRSPDVAIDNNGFWVTWERYSSGSLHYAQRMEYPTGSGSPAVLMGPSGTVANTNPVRIASRAATGDATFVYAFPKVHWCAMSASGTSDCGSPSDMNFVTTGMQDAPAITMLANGRRLGVWQLFTSGHARIRMRPF